MVIGRAPVRVSLGGGGTDLPFFASRFGGFVLSVAIDKYAYVAINRPVIDHLIRVRARLSEEVDSVVLLKNDLVRAALMQTGIDKQVEISFFSDVADGTGLGTSGAYAVNLIHTLNHYKNAVLDRHTLAEDASHLEMGILNRPVGKHDHYMAAFGGLKLLRIANNGSVAVEDPPIKRETLEGLKDRLALFYTGKRHESTEILGKQKELSEQDPRVIDYYQNIKSIGERVYRALMVGDLPLFGGLLHEHWSSKRKLFGVSDRYFDELYEGACRNGAVGGKLIGAGGGGLFMFYVEPQKRLELTHWLRGSYGMREIPFNYDWQGSTLFTSLQQ